jgi:predicted SAM-dependent methyltransferase
MSEANRELRRLHWGCGNSARPGWINSDCRAIAGVNLPSDIRIGLPLESDCIDYAVSVHALQEIPYPQLIAVLQELRRVLKPDGVLRLCLPDLDKAMQAYQRGEREHFLVPDEDAASLGGKLIVHILWYSHSRVMFTFDFIEELLTRAGFRSVRRCEFGRSDFMYSGITELDNREHESLFVEAVK